MTETKLKNRTSKTPSDILPGVFVMLLAALLAVLCALKVVELRSLMITLGALALCLVSARLLRRFGLASLPVLVFCAIMSYVCVQLLSIGSFTWFSDVGGPLHLFGAAWVLAIYLLLYALTGRGFASAVSGGALFLAFGVVDYTVRLFRGRPVLAIDVTSISTALSVTDSYEFSVTAVFCAALALAVLTVLLARLLLRGAPRPRRRLTGFAVRALSLGAACWYIYASLFTYMLAYSGLHINWDENEFEDSAIMYFIVTAQKLNVSEPEGYGGEALDAIAESAAGGEAAAEVRPNIIVVMSEAFSDLSVLGDFETSQSVTPFVDSLREESVHGYVYSSVFGGNTANSEYEFLTGDTMAFVPTGAVPYQLYVNYETDTLVSVLKAQGYSADAMHPYLSSGWNRPQVYDLFGFDNVYFKDDFKNRKFLRNYVTDQCNYANVIRWFEEKAPEDGPLFFFNITMQNHGSYGFEGFEPEVTITGHEGEFPMAEQYLSLLRITDAATEDFIDYFRGVDEPTIILFFGDHQPNLDAGFYELLFGKDELTREETERKYATPFFIWANYELEARDAGVTSLNYLSGLLLREAGLATTGYQGFLAELAEDWPVINSQGAMDAAGNWHSLYDDVFSTSGDVRDYRILQYNHLMDPAGVRRELFGLDRD